MGLCGLALYHSLILSLFLSTSLPPCYPYLFSLFLFYYLPSFV